VLPETRTVLTEQCVTPKTLQLFLLRWSPAKFMVGQAMRREMTMAAHHRDSLGERRQQPRGTRPPSRATLPRRAAAATCHPAFSSGVGTLHRQDPKRSTVFASYKTLRPRGGKRAV